MRRQQADTKVVQEAGQRQARQQRVSDEVMAEHDNTALCLPPPAL